MYIQTTTSWRGINHLPAPLSFPSLLFSDFLFSPSFVQNYNPAVDVLLRWLSTEIGPLELKTPEGASSLLLVIDKNKRRARRREAGAPTKEAFKPYSTPPSAPPYHSSCWTCFAVKRARLSSHPWRAALRCIDHSLVTSAINSDESEPNQKFYVYLSALRFLGGRRCPRHLSLT